MAFGTPILTTFSNTRRHHTNVNQISEGGRNSFTPSSKAWLWLSRFSRKWWFLHTFL